MTAKGNIRYTDIMNDGKKKTVGRFAPTPSGRLHLGNIFTAMLAYLSAKSKGGDFILRVEDLDKERCPSDAVKIMLDDLNWFGFTFDGEILYQSERGEIYNAILEQPQIKPLLYPCYCSRARLAATAPHGATPVYDGKCRNLPERDRPNKKPSLRITVPDEIIQFTDGVQGVYRENLATECGDFIVRRADGIAAYQLAVTVDDALSGVTEVVRGRDLLSSTPRQIFLYELLGFTSPCFYHTPLLLGEHGERLSKREGSSNLEYIRSRFSDPAPIIGMLAANAGLLDKPDPVTLPDLIPEFSWNKIKPDDVFLNAFGLL